MSVLKWWCEYIWKYKTIQSAFNTAKLTWATNQNFLITCPVIFSWIQTTFLADGQGWSHFWGSLWHFPWKYSIAVVRVYLEMGNARLGMFVTGLWNRGTRLRQLCMQWSDETVFLPVVLLVIMSQHLFQGLFRIAGGASKVKKLKVKKAVTVSEGCFVNIYTEAVEHLNLFWSSGLFCRLNIDFQRREMLVIWTQYRF